MATKHISADTGDFAPTVIMPGDPLRAKYIAETYFEKPQLVSDVRNMFGFTGTYKGWRVSVMAHGMGIPSASIYCTELIRDYGVRRIYRTGSCGATAADVKLRDVLVAQGASTDSVVNRIRFRGYDYAAIASYPLLESLVNTARSQGTEIRVGNVFSTDLFYSPDDKIWDALDRLGVLGIEMELAGIYGVAAEFGAEAVGVCTVSDHIRRNESLSSEERATTFDEMIVLALESARRLAAED